MQLSVLVLAVTAAVAVNAIASSLERRDLPPCSPCPNTDKAWLAEFSPTVENIAMESQEDVTDADWWPQACETHGYVCIQLGPGVNYRGGGEGWGYPLARYDKPDGTQIYVSKYWSSTIQFTGAGVTFNVYPAHCTVYILSKGQSAIVAVNGQIVMLGPEQGCFGGPENIDIGVIQLFIAESESETDTEKS